MAEAFNAVQVRASLLADALKPCATAPRQNAVVGLAFDAKSGQLTVEEADYGRFAIDLEAAGVGTLGVQVDGPRLRALIKRYPPSAVLTLGADQSGLTVAHQKSTVRLPGRHHAKQAFETPKEHKGPVEAKPDVKWIEPPKGDTWDFSAQVPFPER
jgi:hypothetical protein